MLSLPRAGSSAGKRVHTRAARAAPRGDGAPDGRGRRCRRRGCRGRGEAPDGPPSRGSLERFQRVERELDDGHVGMAGRGPGRTTRSGRCPRCPRRGGCALAWPGDGSRHRRMSVVRMPGSACSLTTPPSSQGRQAPSGRVTRRPGHGPPCRVVSRISPRSRGSGPVGLTEDVGALQVPVLLQDRHRLVRERDLTGPPAPSAGTPDRARQSHGPSAAPR